jgi:hypothetical protein
MQKLLFAVGTAFLRAFAASFLALSTGIFNAPNADAALALSIAALCASLAAGIRAIQVFIPQLTFAHWVSNTTVGAWIDSFVRAFIASLATFAAGWLAAPDWSTAKSAWYAAVLGAMTAGLRVLQGLATPGEQPAPNSGLKSK